MALDTEKIIADLKEASILELNDLVKAIEDEFGVSAAAPVAAAGAAAGAAEEKTEFDVELTSAGARLRLSKLSRTLRVLALRMPRAWLTVHHPLSRKALLRTKLKKSKLNLKKLAHKLLLNSLICLISKESGFVPAPFLYGKNR